MLKVAHTMLKVACMLLFFSSGDRGAKRKRGGNSNSRDNSSKPCKFFTEKGSCNPKEGKTCDFKHCNVARAAHLQEQLNQLK